MKTTKTILDLTRSQTALRLGIDNTSYSFKVGRNLRKLLDALHQVEQILQASVQIHSGFRCEALERILTQKDYLGWCKRRNRRETEASWLFYFKGKAHPQGFAVDFTCEAFGAPVQVVEALRLSGMKFNKLIAEGDWVHLSIAPAMRQLTLTATFTEGIPSYQTFTSPSTSPSPPNKKRTT